MHKNLNRTYSKAITDFIADRGIKYVCACPGSRNTPLTEAVINHKSLTCFSIFDERSACFYALGLSKASSKPVAILTTSGTATANLFPAIIEAKLNSIPLLVLTADRPFYQLDTGASQTIDQRNLYGRYVNDMIEIDFQKQEINTILKKISRSINKLYGDHKVSGGPVHINFRIDKPLFDNIKKISIDYIPNNKNQKPVSKKIKLPDFKNPLIICGPLNSYGNSKHIIDLSKKINAPIIADILSQMRNENVLCYYDQYLDYINPDLIIRFGDKPISKKLNTFLDKYKKITYLIHDHFKENDDCPNKIIQKFDKLNINLQTNQIGDNIWINKIRENEKKAEKIVSSIMNSNTQAGLVHHIFSKFNNKDHIFIGNSMLIRMFDQFSGSYKPLLKLLGNHITRGIDGLVSTALGASYINKKNNYLFLGDVSLFYDSNGFHALRNNNIDLNVIVINNKGGQIFSQLPYAEKNINKFNDYWITPPQTTIKNIASLFNLKYYKMKIIDLIKNINKISSYNGVKIIEVPINHVSDMKFLESVEKKINKAFLPQK